MPDRPNRPTLSWALAVGPTARASVRLVRQCISRSGRDGGNTRSMGNVREVLAWCDGLLAQFPRALGTAPAPGPGLPRSQFAAKVCHTFAVCLDSISASKSLFKRPCSCRRACPNIYIEIEAFTTRIACFYRPHLRNPDQALLDGTLGLLETALKDTSPNESEHSAKCRTWTDFARKWGESQNWKGCLVCKLRDTRGKRPKSSPAG